MTAICFAVRIYFYKGEINMKIFRFSDLPVSLQSGAELASDYLGEGLSSRVITVCAKPSADGGLSICLDKDNAQIQYSKNVQFFRGLSLLKEWLVQGKQCAKLQEEPAFEHLCYMMDCSRNGVASVSYLKQLLLKLSLMGYDRMMLYTEDTYEVEGYPYFGHFRGRYSKEELRELDRFADSLGIEMVPCIQTLAHLNAIFRWPVFQNVHDTDDILLCESEETYALIEAMIRTWAETFHSRCINIGMDEAEMVGRGEYLNRFGYQERIDIMQRHLKRVLEICQKYGYTCMMWSDMFFKMITGGKYYGKDIHITEEIKEKIPDNVQLIYWDYYARDEETYERMMKYHRELAGDVAFAGGAWKWNGYAPLMNHSMQVSKLALKKCEEHGIRDVIVTGWGDDGNEASQSSVLPVLSLYAEYSYARTTDDSVVAQRLLSCAGADLQDFLKLDCLNLTPDNPLPGNLSCSPAKYLLYQDVLLGIYDCHIERDSYVNHYEKCAKELCEIAEKGGEYAPVFETLSLLARVLSKKVALGIDAKTAYDQKDRLKLFAVSEDCLETIALLEDFHNALRKQWNLENKIFGFEVLDLRLGGLKERLKAAASRLTSYANGELDCIEELEAPRLPLILDENGSVCSPVKDNTWQKMVTASVL